MKRAARALLAMAASGLVACEVQDPSGRDRCTLEAIGEETGAHSFNAELLIPKSYQTGAETTNGGIVVLQPGCDFPLNAFFADATANVLIEQAASFPEGREYQSPARAELFIWRFRDGSREPRFFVRSFSDLEPTIDADAAQRTE
ncbi:hypothetical protein [Pelagerythrobacter rhizovicinus]|uniref:Lipoprotein n=1 Tax=Pelagerythrobacter rhizovicinus TaxID=2268576 RepID=A0A4Q2KR76_9SPHN|nr:hypothetical protein [Pelagerythrobacter rhizovicinus]RXZ66152.1 hypothetical protein ETX26_05420 [Pelagerythrobacter rhizovicinus]